MPNVCEPLNPVVLETLHQCADGRDRLEGMNHGGGPTCCLMDQPSGLSRPCQRSGAKYIDLGKKPGQGFPDRHRLLPAQLCQWSRVIVRPGGPWVPSVSVTNENQMHYGRSQSAMDVSYFKEPRNSADTRAVMASSSRSSDPEERDRIPRLAIADTQALPAQRSLPPAQILDHFASQNRLRSHFHG